MTRVGGPRRSFGNNLRSRLGWRDASRDVREEMRLHLELRVAELETAGLTRAAARQQARREVGDPSDVAAAVAPLARTTDRNDAWRQRLDECVQDLRHGLRVFRGSPGFATLAVMMIALGLGGNAAIFALVNLLFLRPLPFDPDGRLIRVREYRQTASGPRVVDASRRTADAVAARTDLFIASVPMVNSGRALLRSDGAVHLEATRVGPGFTRVLGVTPMLGRTFTAEEERAGETGGAVLVSHRMWRTVFGGRREALGETVRFDNSSFTIVGVLPAAFHVPYGSDVWLPSRFEDNERSVFILARLAHGVSLDQAKAELEPMGRRLNEQYPDVMRGMGVTAVGLREYFIEGDDRVPLALMVAVGFLLLISCADVALLLTARFAARRKEVALRAALGCGRARQVRQFVTETLLLFVVGGGLGLLLAFWLRDSLAVLLPEAIATQVGFERIPLDARVVGFTMALSVAVGLLFGLVASFRATRTDLNSVLKDSGRSLAGEGSRRTLGALVAGEMALAVVLLTAGGVMTDTFYRLYTRDPGFDPRGVLTVRAEVGAERYATADARLAYLDRFLQRVRALPGVGAAGITTVNPLCCGNWGARMSAEGQPPTPEAQAPVVQHQLVTPGYLETMRMRLVDGRGITAADVAGREPVAVVDRGLAERFWPGERAVGRRVKRGAFDSPYPWMTIVGVVAPIEHAGEYTESWFLPYAQHPTGPSSVNLHLMVRSSGDPLALVPAVKAIGTDIDPALALHEITTMDAVRSERLQQNRVGAFIAVVFGAAGLALAGLGLYGVLAFVVASDTREIGVRLALGAGRVDLLRLVVVRSLRMAGAGLTVGAIAAVVVARALEGLVPDARLDLRIIAVAATALLAVTLAASVLPARRTLRLDPVEALRAD